MTADSDGQHTAQCIIAIQENLVSNPASLILGVRNFNGDNIPWKSLFGNRITMKVMKYVTGLSISDTQTGLRGIPCQFMKQLLDIPGERFEFETQMLLASSEKYPIVEVQIQTIYDSKEEHQTHFNPVMDSIKIYGILMKRFLKYIFSSLSSCVIDLVLFSLCCFLFKKKTISYIVISTVFARIISATYNYMLNYKIVFNSYAKHTSALIKYIILATLQMTVSAFVVNELVKRFIWMPEYLIKAAVDTILFFLSYYIQKTIVFTSSESSH